MAVWQKCQQLLPTVSAMERATLINFLLMLSFMLLAKCSNQISVVRFPLHNCSLLITLIFTIQCYASAVYTMVPCLDYSSVTSWCSVKTAKHIIMQTVPHKSQMTLVLGLEKLRTMSSQLLFFCEN